MVTTERAQTYRAEAVDTGRETIHNGHREDTILSRGVDALEEGKRLRVQRISRVDRGDRLYGDMRVSNDNVVLQLLRCPIVVGVCVDKVTGDQILDVHREGEVLVGRECTTIGREADLRGRHVARGDDVSIYDTIAASTNELLAISERLSLAEVDAVK
jgi:hypothetical protein